MKLYTQNQRDYLPSLADQQKQWIEIKVTLICLIFLQNLCVFLVSLFANRQGSLGTNEKTSIEGYIAPGVLTILSALLCYGLADKIY